MTVPVLNGDHTCGRQFNSAACGYMSLLLIDSIAGAANSLSEDLPLLCESHRQVIIRPHGKYGGWIGLFTQVNGKSQPGSELLVRLGKHSNSALSPNEIVDDNISSDTAL